MARTCGQRGPGPIGGERGSLTAGAARAGRSVCPHRLLTNWKRLPRNLSREPQLDGPPRALTARCLPDCSPFTPVHSLPAGPDGTHQPQPLRIEITLDRSGFDGPPPPASPPRIKRHLMSCSWTRCVINCGAFAFHSGDLPDRLRILIMRNSYCHHVCQPRAAMEVLIPKKRQGRNHTPCHATYIIPYPVHH